MVYARIAGFCLVFLTIRDASLALNLSQPTLPELRRGPQTIGYPGNIFVDQYAECTGFIAESLASFLKPHEPEKDNFSTFISPFLQIGKVSESLI